WAFVDATRCRTSFALSRLRCLISLSRASADATRCRTSFTWSALARSRSRRAFSLPKEDSAMRSSMLDRDSDSVFSASRRSSAVLIMITASPLALTPPFTVPVQQSLHRAFGDVENFRYLLLRVALRTQRDCGGCALVEAGQ